MDEQNQQPVEEKHWLSVAAEFDERLGRIERRQANFASRLIRVEGGSKSGTGDPMMEGIVWIMVLGIAAQILTPLLESVIRKWSSSSS